MKYLLDTDICIYLIKRRPLSVVQKLTELSNDDVGLSTISVFELQYGVETSQHQKQSQLALDHFLESLPQIVPIDQQVAMHAARVRGELKKKGTPIGPYDVLIAAAALAHKLILVSNNINEFARVDGLMFENWASDDG